MKVIPDSAVTLTNPGSLWEETAVIRMGGNE
jgi:hypothetical protein